MKGVAGVGYSNRKKRLMALRENKVTVDINAGETGKAGSSGEIKGKYYPPQYRPELVERFCIRYQWCYHYHTAVTVVKG